MTSQTSPNSKVLWVYEMPWRRRTNPGFEVKNTCVCFLAVTFTGCVTSGELLNLSEPRFLIWKPGPMPTKSLSGRWNNKVLFRHGTGCQKRVGAKVLLVLIHTSFWLGQKCRSYLNIAFVFPSRALLQKRERKKEINSDSLRPPESITHVLKCSSQSKTRLLIIHCYWNRK